MREVVPATVEPLTLEEVRIHLRQYADSLDDSPAVDDSPADWYPDDSWVLAKITAARIYCEDFLGFPLSDATYEIALSEFSVPIDLPFNTTQVVSVTYLDEANVPTTVDPLDYYYDDFGFGLWPEGEWPVALSTRQNGIRVRFRGMTSDDSPAPYVDEAIKQAMLLLLGSWYENREAVAVGVAVNDMPFAVEALLRPKRVRLGMA